MRLRDLLDIDELGIRLRAGSRQLDRSIGWVYTTDLVDPSRFLNGGELVLTSGLWHPEPGATETFVTALADANATALVLGTAYLGAVPEDVLHACRTHRLPLLEVPDDVSFRAVSEAVLTRTLAGQTRYLGAMLNRHRHMLSAAGGHRGVQPVLESLSAELGADCWLLSGTGRVLSGTGTLSSLRAVALATLAIRARLPAVFRVEEGPPSSVYAASDRTVTCGRLLVCDSSYRDWPLDRRELVEDAARVLAIEEARTLEGRRASRHLARQVFKLLATEHSQPAEVSSLLELAGLHEAPTRVVLALWSETPEQAAVAVEDLQPQVVGRPLVTVDGDQVLACIGWAPESGRDPLQVVKDRAALVEPLFAGASLKIGIGEPANTVSGTRRSLNEAQHALALARRDSHPHAVASARDVRSAGLLLTHVPPDVRSTYRTQILGPVLNYDLEHDADLELTLRTFLDAAGSWQTCAERMHLHVNTIRYRIRRVQELLGRNISAPDDRVDLYLATHLAVQ
jgi:DNA-binding PucR family transcriptional regulator